MYGIDQDLRGCLFLAISQSGRSPDLLASVAAAKESGATVIALCNVADSPLVSAADHFVPLRAGPEISVAATKSYLASLAAIARLVAAWTENAALQSALNELPALMDRAWQLDWTGPLPLLQTADHLYVVGRGLGLGAAQEVALKCKETCGLHAESFSSAEVRHGPFTLLGPRFPALLLAQNDATRPGLEALANELVARGTPVFIAGAATSTRPTRAAEHRMRGGARADPRRAKRVSHDREPLRPSRVRSGSAREPQQDHGDTLMRTALIGGRVLTPSGVRTDRTVIVDGARIEALVAPDDPRANDARVEDLKGQLLAPGLIDTQVNGGGGVLFNDGPDSGSIRAIGAAHRRFGTTGFLPTLISDDLDVIARAIAAVQSAIASGIPGVLGIHIEGPFLNRARRGVHDAKHLRKLDSSIVPLLCSLGVGKTLVTLAPEMTTPEVIAELTARGVIVAAGHSNATFSQATRAIAHGLRGFTHLFNAMSPLAPREPGAVGAALYDDSTWCGIIIDGNTSTRWCCGSPWRCTPARTEFMLVGDAMLERRRGHRRVHAGRQAHRRARRQAARRGWARSRAPACTWPAPSLTRSSYTTLDPGARRAPWRAPAPRPS